MKIKELEWDVVPDAAVVVCIGRRKSGKTVNIIDIFYKKRNSFRMGLVFCGSKATVKQYEAHFPASFIYDGYHSAVVGAVIDKQERDVEMNCAKPIFILIDDCMWAKKSLLSDPNIRRLFMNGRHSLIFFVLSMQYAVDLPPSLRSQIDFTLLSREKNPQNRDRLFRSYNVCFRTFEEFDRCMMQCTLNHETFVLCNGSDTDSDNPEDNVFWWKSKFDPDGRRFRVNKNGTWWAYHKKLFNSNHFDKTLSGTIITKIKTHQSTCSSKSLPIIKPPTSSHSTHAVEYMKNQRQLNIGTRTSGIKNIDDDRCKHI